jgi:hypothetical protein
MKECTAVCKPVTIFHTEDQGVLTPEVRQSVIDTELNIKSMLVWESVYYKEAHLQQISL